MASVVSNKRGGWEIRESHSTANGPRSKTLATFRVLDGEVLDRAEARAEKPFDRDDVLRRAYRVGAEVSASKADEAARTLITELAHGARIDAGLSGALVGFLDRLDPPTLSPEAMAAAEWAGESLAERGRTLYQLLQLADALPQKRAGTELKFPGLDAR
jgi:hypothetical protein